MKENLNQNSFRNGGSIVFKLRILSKRNPLYCLSLKKGIGKFENKPRSISN